MNVKKQEKGFWFIDNGFDGVSIYRGTREQYEIGCERDRYDYHYGLFHDTKDDAKREAIEYLKDNFIEAAEEGHKDIVEVLIKAGVDVNVKDDEGETALMMAAENGHKEVVKMLIKAGADVNVKDNDGWTALMRAAEEGHKKIVEMIESHS